MGNWFSIKHHSPETSRKHEEAPGMQNLKCFTFVQLKTATNNFRPHTYVGKGRFGKVHKGCVNGETYLPSKDGIAIAVKILNPNIIQGLQDCHSEIEYLGKFSHPNLVKLLGYCQNNKQYLLVYEYMQRGSLDNHLFNKLSVEPLPWDIRLKIAIGAARGLSFLHTTEKSFIYLDFKSANILLDGAYNAKLSDFGLAKLEGDKSCIATHIGHTCGYVAPEYWTGVTGGRLFIESDVYGFGVVLLEILTGIQAMDTNIPEHNLVNWARPFLCEYGKLKRIMDKRLKQQYPIKAACQIAKLIVKCLELDRHLRPSMEVVVDTLEKISTIKDP